MDIYEYCTPIESCVYVRLGEIEASTVDVLVQSQHDQAVVKDKDDAVVGIVETEHLQHLLENRVILTETDEKLFRTEVDASLSLMEVLTTLADSRAALVVKENGGKDPVELGLITISDLNRHTFRAMLYSLLVKLETELALLIERSFANPWDWISLLNEDTQAAILGYWELSKRRNVDIGPVAATTLSQLINVLEKGKLVGRLGFASGNQFGKSSGSIPKLRNSVMHPIRPLITDMDSVKKVKETVELIIRLTEKAKQANA